MEISDAESTEAMDVDEMDVSDNAENSRSGISRSSPAPQPSNTRSGWWRIPGKYIVVHLHLSLLHASRLIF